MFARFESTGFESALELISEDSRFEVPGDMSAEPDVYVGHEGARRYFAGFEGMLEDLGFEVLDVEEDGEVATAWMRFTGRGVTSGIEVEQYAAINVWFDDDKVARMRAHPDMDAARAARRW
jgi:ketosteroid isomerase-like protein